MSGLNIGNYIPRVAKNKVFLGHWCQTINFEEKQETVNRFFQQKDDNYKRSVISKYNIKYIYYGIEERKLGLLEENQLLKLVYQNNKVKIFKAI